MLENSFHWHFHFLKFRKDRTPSSLLHILRCQIAKSPEHLSLLVYELASDPRYSYVSEFCQKICKMSVIGFQYARFQHIIAEACKTVFLQNSRKTAFRKIIIQKLSSPGLFFHWYCRLKERRFVPFPTGSSPLSLILESFLYWIVDFHFFEVLKDQTSSRFLQILPC